MVNVDTLNQMQRFYKENESEILASDSRFAVITPGLELAFYSDRDSLYSEYPDFAPGAPIKFGTGPMIIDIGKETNSPEYQREVLESRKENAQRNLLESRRELADAESELEKLSEQD